MNERDMVELLRKRYCAESGNGPAAVLIPQVRNAAGFNATRTADALVMQLWPSRGLHLEGFEVKCSRADVMKELKDPSKAEAFAQYCEKWWLVLADKTHIREGELPEPWGLLVKSGNGLRCVKDAPVRDVPKHLPKTMLAALLRQTDRESLRPGAEALKNEYERGVEAGKRGAGYASRELEDLKERVVAFEKATGLTVSYTNGQKLEAQGRVVRLLLGTTGSNFHSALLPQIDQLIRSADKLRAAFVDAGLVDP